MKIALAQVSSVDGNVEKNIETHLNAINIASQHNIDYIK